jgi:hypothetical protein
MIVTGKSIIKEIYKNYIFCIENILKILTTQIIR